MKWLPTFLVASGTLVLGGIIGFYICASRYSRAATDIITSDEFVKECDTINTLRDFRAGNTNEALNELEKRLDIGIISLNGILEDDPAIEHAQNYTNLLLRIAEYRTRFSHHNDDTDLDSMVTEVLTNIAKITNR